MDLNPYARFLGEDDALAVIRETPPRLQSLVEGLSPEAAERPRAPGKWNAREIVAHLADCEMVFAFRLRQTLSEDHHTVQPFDQGKWAERYSAYALGPAQTLFSSARNWTITLLDRVANEEWSRPVIHPERGAMTLRTIVETMAGHDRNHLLQLEAIAGGQFAE